MLAGEGAAFLCSATRSGAMSGHWVLLQNCHLSLGFLKQLSVIVSDLAVQESHKDFRLILTTVPCDAFPSAILLVRALFTRFTHKHICACTYACMPYRCMSLCLRLLLNPSASSGKRAAVDSRRDMGLSAVSCWVVFSRKA